MFVGDYDFLCKIDGKEKLEVEKKVFLLDTLKIILEKIFLILQEDRIK